MILAFFLVALLYAAVGQAGATGYIALMAILGLPPLEMKVTALVLNLVVAAIGTCMFQRAAQLSWRNLYPFALLGFPFSVLGGSVNLGAEAYYPLVGTILMLSGLLMARSALLAQGKAAVGVPNPPPFIPALITGAVIGFVSGTTGTGGGVFLAPIILAMNWADARQTAATTAVYNLVNSAAALIGAYAFWPQISASAPIWMMAVAIGGLAGAVLGSRFLSDKWLRAILALLLAGSGLKLIW